MVRFYLHSCFLFICLLFGCEIEANSNLKSAIFVDKKTNRLHVCQLKDEKFEIVKTYHATLGQVKGDKEKENDLKTPEGIYTFTAILYPPSLPPKFGMMSFVMNFPNPFDILAGYTGFGIMLHATNEPERLKKNYDSEGCIVVKNEEILEIKPFITLGLTPILIFEELTEGNFYSERFSADKEPGAKAEATQDSSPANRLGAASISGISLKRFFESWIQSWEKKEILSYIAYYHTDFSAQGKNKAQWKTYKEGLNRRYAQIEINPENAILYRHPKYSMITFTQNYRSQLKNGSWGHRSRGTKTLYIAEELGQPKIISEKFSRSVW